MNTHVLTVKTLFDGTYIIRGHGEQCSVDIDERYEDSQNVIIPLSSIFKDSKEERFCTISIQINPTIKDSEVVIYPRYSILRIHVSKRLGNKTFSTQLRETTSMVPIEIIANGSGEYQIVKKCVYESEAKLIGPFNHSGIISLTGDLLGLDTGKLGNCYFSLLYKDNDGTKRFGYSTNVYDMDFEPLSLIVKNEDKKIRVIGPKEMYLCGIGNVEKTGKYKCSRKLKELPEHFVIQGHTNKRSRYIIGKK